MSKLADESIKLLEYLEKRVSYDDVKLENALSGMLEELYKMKEMVQRRRMDSGKAPMGVRTTVGRA